MTRELGEHRDAHLEIERIARASGPILESAIQSLINLHAPFFSQTGPDLRHRLTGQTMEEWIAGRRKSNPNDYADYAPDDPEQALFVCIEEACLTPSPKTMAEKERGRKMRTTHLPAPHVPAKDLPLFA